MLEKNVVGSKGKTPQNRFNFRLNKMLRLATLMENDASPYRIRSYGDLSEKRAFGREYRAPWISVKFCRNSLLYKKLSLQTKTGAGNLSYFQLSQDGEDILIYKMTNRDSSLKESRCEGC